jgi:ankyrin repeat protein
LWVACTDASAAVVERLLKAGADPNRALVSGETPLMAASRVGNGAAVTLLLAHGADANAREHDRAQTALMWAASEGHPEAVAALIAGGADVHARSRVSPTVVYIGTATDSDQRFALVDADNDAPTGIAEIPQGGYTPLLFAARRGDRESARFLLAAGAAVDEAAPVGTSALVVAAHSGHGPFATFLLDQGADPNAAGGGYAALHAAILRRDAALVKALLAHGADPNLPILKATPARRVSADYALLAPMVGATPFWLAAQFAEAETMSVLAAGGADPRFAMHDGTTALMATFIIEPGRGGQINPLFPVASERMILDAVKVAATLGVDVNAADQAGDTALHLAASRGLTTVVQFLAAQGARLDAKNQKGQTPLALAIAKKAGKTADLLRTAGATE